MSFIRYGKTLINLRQIISVSAKDATTLRFVYPVRLCEAAVTGSWGWLSDDSKMYDINVEDSHIEINRIEKLLSAQNQIPNQATRMLRCHPLHQETRHCSKVD